MGHGEFFVCLSRGLWKREKSYPAQGLQRSQGFQRHQSTPTRAVLYCAHGICTAVGRAVLLGRGDVTVSVSV